MCSDLDPDPYFKGQGHTRSNNMYFLFSHSLPVVVYNFGQVQRTSQVERKTKCLQKNNGGGIAVLWTALFSLNVVYLIVLIYISDFTFKFLNLVSTCCGYYILRFEWTAV